MTLVLAFATALAVTWLVTPLAIRVARATGFIDKPAGYKGHDAPTPYLGGSAIMAGILVAAISFGGAGHGRWVLVAAAAACRWACSSRAWRWPPRPTPRSALEPS